MLYVASWYTDRHKELHGGATSSRDEQHASSDKHTHLVAALQHVTTHACRHTPATSAIVQCSGATGL